MSTGMKVIALVPVKQDSERLKNKNFLVLDGKPLNRVILDKLQDIEQIQEIVINTDSDIISEDCSRRYSKARIIDRPQSIRGNEVTMNTIISYDLSQVEGEHFLQTHCTNPLLSKQTIVRAIQQYFEKLDQYDSLLAVESIKKRAYDYLGHPINHDNKRLLQTQDLPEIYIENSNIFLFSRTSFLNASNSRVGKRPQLFPMNAIEGLDIDYEEDFSLAELIALHKSRFPGLD
jgi:CMP-N-acetylneuraminic acid synthetase